ncbi:Set1-like protein [Lasiodiplodia theobromae]|uniref:Set1-like protein n=1 Tax=Lasiodiplodia theobromae TaxID=45133 RepID=UPI0015C3037D|nr:Set1-like protein [Lasiodiplodia theobromae]KAF4538942.1 Set1-like protein [Lasiodiplodia theobromae]
MIATDPRLRGRATGANGLAAAVEVHKHSSGRHPTQKHNYDVEKPRATEILHNMQSHPDTQIDLDESGPKTHGKHHTANAAIAKPRSAAFEKVQAPKKPAEGDADHAVPWDVQQADLQPEIPDLSLDIAEVDRTEKPDDKTVPVLSKGSEELIEGSPEAPKSPQDKKRNSRSRCSEEDGTPVPPSSVTAEEIWRRRLQPEKYHANGVASPTKSASQDAKAPQFKSEHSIAKQPQRDLEADVSRQPTLADDLSSLQSIAESESAGCSREMTDTPERRYESIASPKEVERQEDAATPETVPRGPSAEANGLERRRSWSPVNKTINNDDDAGMESDNALSTIGSEGARDSRSDAVSGERPNVGRKVANATEPSAKLPGCFSWPDLIGFALAEASDHRMTAAQVHQWIANNVENYDINNTTQRSSIAATLSQQKVKFPKAEPIMEGARHLSRWKISPDWVVEFKANLETEREKLHKKTLQAGRSSSTQRRKEFHDAPKGARAAANTSVSKQAHAQKEGSKSSTHAEETPMFIKRHRVAYDADGRDIVAGFKDIPIERWTQLAEVQSFRRHDLRFFVGDFIKAPLPNRFRFADYTHKPLVHTMAQIEEIRQRRDGPGYAILVQWFLTKEAADWWKCRQVKSLWPKDERPGIYVPATVWDILTSDFVAEQEKIDAEEAKHQIIPTLFFDLDTDKWRLYLKEGRGPRTGIAFGSHSLDEEDSGAEDTAPALDQLEESPPGPSHQIDNLQNHEDTTKTEVALRTKLTMDPDEIPRQQSPSNSLSSSHLVFSRKAGSSASPESPRTGISIGQSEPDSVRNADLERQLFTPSPTDGPMAETADEREHRMTDQKSQGRRSAPTPITERPTKRQKTEVTPEEQAAIRAIIQMDRDNAKHDTRDLWAAAPEYDPTNDLWDREAKIAEIKARPSRKARFSKNLAYARRDRPPNALYVELDRPEPKGYKAPPPNRPGSGYSNLSPAKTARVNGARLNLDVDDPWNSDFNDTDMPDAPTQATTVGGTPAGIGEASNGENDDLDSEKPEMFDTLEELLGLPPNFVPTLYEGRLAFRDGTMGLDGRMPRAKKIFKVGRNVPGELK